MSGIGPEGWIAWGGGCCPVPGDARVDVQLSAREGVGASPLENLWARDLNWRFNDDSGDIVAYRLTPPPTYVKRPFSLSQET